MKWSLNNDSPIYSQLVKEITMRIISGFYPLSSKLLSVRDLSQEANVNPNTMQKALQELERTGLVITQGTIGRVVTDNVDIIVQTKKLFAKSEIEQFLSNMQKLGYTSPQVIQLLENNCDQL